ncbi:MAG TPA: crosslink repair DNA glycosylase YcaQ family protein, partial [Limnochordia bacterium]|nr:crosslink repair DNA glycosylase YcaQ family protein [Limnochordia bacterium]
ARRLAFETFANARCVLPMERWPLFAPQLRRRAERAREHHPEAAAACAHVLERLEREGPLAARHFESEKTLGFWDLSEAKTKLTSLALELLWAGGQIVLTHRDEGERFYDLAERVVPADLLAAGRDETEASARDGLARAYCRAYGLISPTGPHRLWQLISAQEAAAWFDARTAAGELVPVRIEDVRRPYLVAAGDVEALRAAAGWASGSQLHLLPPLDNLLWDRRRLVDLWDFDYTWEIYTPAAKRRFGPYTLPILQGDRLVGRVDCRADRTAGRLVINLLHWEPGVQSGVRRRAALERALADLAAFLGIAYGGSDPAPG